MKKILYCISILAILCFFAGDLSAQDLYSWSNLGPDNLGSKTRSIVFDSDGNVFAGSVGGGLYKSTTSGSSWVKVSSYTGNPNVTCMAVNGSNIYVGTGETDFSFGYYNDNVSGFDVSTFTSGYIGYTGLPGSGVYVSNDNGSTWSNVNATTEAPFMTNQNLGPFVGIQQLSVHGNRAFVATREGLYYSDDNFNSVTLSSGSEAFQTSAIFDVKGGDGNVVYAATADSVYISSNNGQSFISINDRFDLSLAPSGRLGATRIAIAVAPTNSQVAYVGGVSFSGELTGIWRTNDNGASWESYAPNENPGFTPLGSEGRDAFTLAVFADSEDEVIVAGNAWYTFTQEDGWIQSAQHFFAGRNDYLPTDIHCVTFDPNNSSSFYVGTDMQIMRSDDRGASFTQKSKGYEGAAMISVAAFGVEDPFDEENNYDAVFGNTLLNGYVFNRNYASTDNPAAQGFGQISTRNYGKADVSYIYPGAAIIEGSDDGLDRTFTFGGAFEDFYGFPISPQVANLDLNADSDSIIDRGDPDNEGAGLRDDDDIQPVTQWILDEVIPADKLSQGADSLRAIESYVYFCSRQFVWSIKYPLGNPDGLLPRWNRMTNPDLMDSDEFFTAITVDGTENHIVYVGTSKGKIYRLKGVHDLTTFDAVASVTRLDQAGGLQPSLTQSRWVSSLAVDPNNSDILVVTYAAYGDLDAASSMVWYTQNATIDAPASPMFFPLSNPGNLRQPIYSSRFVTDPATGNSVLFAGTERGLYVATTLSPGFADWSQELGEEIGNIPVYDIWVRRYIARVTDEETQDFELIPENKVFIATYGAGVYATSDLVFNREGGPVEDPVAPDAFLANLYPNPSAGNNANIEIHLPEASDVSLSLVTIDGRVLAGFSNENYESGVHTIPFITENLAPGMYFIRIQTKGATTENSVTLKSVVSRQ